MPAWAVCLGRGCSLAAWRQSLQLHCVHASVIRSLAGRQGAAWSGSTLLQNPPAGLAQARANIIRLQPVHSPLHTRHWSSLRPATRSCAAMQASQAATMRGAALRASARPATRATTARRSVQVVRAAKTADGPKLAIVGVT